MRKVKDSGIEWIGEIPASWQVMANKYVMRKSKIISPIYHGEDILSLTMRGVIVRDLNAGGKMPTSFDGYQEIKPGNLLMCLFDIDVTPRCVGLIKQSGLTSPAYSQFVLNDGFDANYFCYYYTMLDNDKTLLHLAKNLRHSLTEDQLGAISVIVPPYPEQQAIADFLDAKCAEIDALSSDIQAQIDTLEQYKRSVISEAVTNGLDPNVPMKDSGIEWIGEIPVGWNVSKIKYIASFGPTCNFRGVLAEDKIAYAPMECVKQGYYEERDAVYQELPRSLTPFQRGDIIMAKVTPCFENGNIAILDKLSYRVGLGSSELFVFRSKKIVAKYLFYWLQNHAFMERACATMTGAGGLKRVSSSFCKNCEIHLPPRFEQQAIADYLDAKCSEIDHVIAQKQEQLSTLADYKKSLIYEYVTGKKEVPAS